MRTLHFHDGALWILDQTRLPHEEAYLECRTERQVADAICRLSVRGAPAIGLAAAYGVVLAAMNSSRQGPEQFRQRVTAAMEGLRATRPTAVNLAWALDRLRTRVLEGGGNEPALLAEQLRAEADRMLKEDLEVNIAMGRHGAELIPDGANVLTHCNAGALATGGFGTALGVVQTAHDQGKRLHVWVDETRPLLQGARLTTWELRQSGIPHTLISDNMAAHFMKRGAIDMVIVGADRIAANGDGANKIGTYGVAVLAHAHGLPFVFVAPTSTVDLATPDGNSITIEERGTDEVTAIRGTPIAPTGTIAANPAFDVTPAHLVSAIVTEAGTLVSPFGPGLERAVAHSRDAQASAISPR